MWWLSRMSKGDLSIKTEGWRLCWDLQNYVNGAHQNPFLGLPWWRSGWESACQCRGHGFKPWSGKIPHAAEQLGLWATTTEPARLELVLRNKRGRDSERPAHCDEEWPPLAATRESPCTETKTQHSQKKKNPFLAFLPCWWEWKMVQPLWKTVRQFLTVQHMAQQAHS